MNIKQRITDLLKKYEEPIFTNVVDPMDRQSYLDDYHTAFV